MEDDRKSVEPRAVVLSVTFTDVTEDRTKRIIERDGTVLCWKAHAPDLETPATSEFFFFLTRACSPNDKEYKLRFAERSFMLGFR
jgi:hypothetical protein